MIIPQNQWTTNSCSQNQDFYEHPYVCTSWAERYACFLIKKWPLWAAQKWLFHSTHIFLRLRHEKNVFCGINFCDVGILWKKCGIYVCNPNVLKKKIRYLSYREIYFVIILTPCRRLFGVMNFSVYWNDVYHTSIVFFYLVS